MTDHWGIRAYRLSSTGVVLDTVSIWTNNHAHWPGRTGQQLLSPEEDTNVITFWREGNPITPRNSYVSKWRVYPTIDTLITKKLEWNYPGRSEYISTQSLLTSDGNFVSAGIMIDTGGAQTQELAHIAKYDINLNVLWETTVLCSSCQYGAGATSILEAPDGSFILAGSSKKPDGLQSPREKTWIAKADNSGIVEWEYLFPILNNDLKLNDGQGRLAVTIDGKIMMASLRAFECPDYDTACYNSFPLARIRLMKFDWDGTILKDTLIGPLVSLTGIWSLQTLPGGGYLISGGRHFNTKGLLLGAYNTVVYKISEEGDSIWWREPYIGNQLNDNHWSYQTKPTVDGGYIGCGLNILHSGRHPWGHPQAGYVYKLDSDGCYGPGDCPTTTIIPNTVSVLLYEEEVDFSFYPNPTQDILHITYANTTHAEYRVVIRDVQGKVVADERLSPNEFEYTHQLDLRHLSQGIYMLEIRSAGKMQATTKVIKQ